MVDERVARPWRATADLFRLCFELGAKPEPIFNSIIPILKKRSKQKSFNVNFLGYEIARRLLQRGLAAHLENLVVLGTKPDFSSSEAMEIIKAICVESAGIYNAVSLSHISGCDTSILLEVVVHLIGQSPSAELSPFARQALAHAAQDIVVPAQWSSAQGVIYAAGNFVLLDAS